MCSWNVQPVHVKNDEVTKHGQRNITEKENEKKRNSWERRWKLQQKGIQKKDPAALMKHVFVQTFQHPLWKMCELIVQTVSY